MQALRILRPVLSATTGYFVTHHQPAVMTHRHVPSVGYQTADLRTQRIGMPVPFVANPRGAKQHDGDLALTGPRCQSIMGAQLGEPAPHAALAGKQSGAEATVLVKADQSLDRQQPLSRAR